MRVNELTNHITPFVTDKCLKVEAKTSSEFTIFTSLEWRGGTLAINIILV